ncbi:MAG: putative sulfate exporter family transporter [Micrococcales bacterium]|nr:putative sulfate exporter family transporter [Micrococcales bacterium]
MCATAGLACTAVSRHLPGVSPLLLAILAGALVGNALTVPTALGPGVAVSAKQVLRWGIVLLGLQVPLGQIVGLGWGALATATLVVAIGLAGTLGLGRLLGVHRGLALLIAAGFSICGAAAVAAVDGVVDSEEEDVAAALGLVVLFGTLAIGVVPAAGALLGLDQHAQGLLVGASVHEVAQVVAAGGIVGGSALSVAVLVKLTRVLLLAPVITAVALRARAARHADAATTGSSARAGERAGAPATSRELPPLVPAFVLGFLALVLVRSTGVLPDALLGAGRSVQTLLLATAMFALGLGVRWDRLRHLGPRPLCLGALSSALVLGVALGGVTLLT